MPAVSAHGTCGTRGRLSKRPSTNPATSPPGPSEDTDLIITHSAGDYMSDHDETSKLLGSPATSER